jgi:hypothetical protein
MNAYDPHDDEPIIFRYTRAQAIEDGVLVDLTGWARETGFVVPVACTASVWHGCIVPPEEARCLGQSERGRAHDVLWLLYCAISACGRASRVLFKVEFQQSATQHATVELKAVCGPGDAREPVITIMRPDED